MYIKIFVMEINFSPKRTSCYAVFACMVKNNYFCRITGTLLFGDACLFL